MRMATTMTISPSTDLTQKPDNGLKIERTIVVLFPVQSVVSLSATGKREIAAILHRTMDPPVSLRSLPSVLPGFHGTHQARHAWRTVIITPSQPSIVQHPSSFVVFHHQHPHQPEAKHLKHHVAASWSPCHHASIHPDGCIDLHPPIITDRYRVGASDVCLHPFIRSFLFHQPICLLAPASHY